MQTLEDFTDDEIKQFTAFSRKKIEEISTSVKTMLKTLKADENSDFYEKIALAIYPELLRDGYFKSQLKDIKKRMVYDARSGAIRCRNKRLFVIPDWYAACEHYFMHIEHPKGLLNKDEVGCRQLVKFGKVDVLRSPHLYMEHFVVKVSNDPKVAEWLATDGIYTSVSSLISRVLQFDCDGDQLNVVYEDQIVEVAERNLKKYDVIPLFYDANKASPEIISKAALFHGLKRAHQFSDIGSVSNMLTRLWNRNNPDRLAAALLCYLNNLRIDGAKTGSVNEYTNYPEVKKRIDKATGGERGRMPYFFQFSKNGRKDEKTKRKRQWTKPNNSTMNRICSQFDDIKNIRFNFEELGAFNWYMLMSAPCYEDEIGKQIVEDFFDMENIRVSMALQEAEASSAEKELFKYSNILEEHITHTLTEKYGSLEKCYPYITKALFSGDGTSKAAHKQTYWRVFGAIAIENLRRNLADCRVCEKCGARIPSWLSVHACPKDSQGFYTCDDCGKLCQRVNSKQCRCADCQQKYVNEKKKASRKKGKESKKESDRLFITRLQSQNKRT